MSKTQPQPPARRHGGQGTDAPRPAASTATREEAERVEHGARAVAGNRRLPTPTLGSGKGAVSRHDKEQADAVRDSRPPHFGTQTSAAENRHSDRTIGARGIKVVAMKTGFYNNERKRVGDVFTIAHEDDFSDFDNPRYAEEVVKVRGKEVTRKVRLPAGWMRRVDRHTPERTTTPNQAIAQEHDDILRSRHGGEAGAGRSADHSPLEDADGEDATKE